MIFTKLSTLHKIFKFCLKRWKMMNNLTTNELSSFLKKQFFSLSFINSDTTLRKWLNNKFFIILKSNFPITILICHFHPAVNIFFCRIVLNTHHGISLYEKCWDLLFWQVTTFIFVKLIKKSFSNLKSFFYFFCVVFGLTLNEILDG